MSDVPNFLRDSWRYPKNTLSLLFPFLKASGRPYRPPETGLKIEPESRGRSLIEVEQPAVLVEREAVGHAGDVVGDQSGAGGPLGRLRALAPWRRQAVGLGEQQPEQVYHHAPRLGVRAVQEPMLVHAGVEELLDGAVGRGHRLRERDDRTAEGANVGHRLRIRFGEALARLGQHVLDHGVDHAA